MNLRDALVPLLILLVGTVVLVTMPSASDCSVPDTDVVLFIEKDCYACTRQLEVFQSLSETYPFTWSTVDIHACPVTAQQHNVNVAPMMEIYKTHLILGFRDEERVKLALVKAQEQQKQIS